MRVNQFIGSSEADKPDNLLKVGRNGALNDLHFLLWYFPSLRKTQPRRYKYGAETLQPFLYFYKLLALKPCNRTHKAHLLLNVPDTIVFNDTDNPVMWFFTNEKGAVVRVDNVPYYDITAKLCEGALEKELVAILKKVIRFLNEANLRLRRSNRE
jgi:hypothetical protein